MTPVTVLIVDDSATMRGLIAAALERDPGVKVVGAVGDPMEARAAIKALRPDVVTLDIEMPNMDGISFLERIMRLRPMPVVMVSSLTQRGADATLQALELGAFDCVAKPARPATDPVAFASLARIVKAAAGARVRPLAPRPAPVAVGPRFRPGPRTLAIGASTGGVEALTAIVSQLPANCPPTVITQHMPATFTGSFAARLDRGSAATVREAAEGALLKPGMVYLAPGDRHLEVSGQTTLRCRLYDDEPVNGHRPSVDRLFSSLARCAGARGVGVILTGMGRDGAKGLLALREGGAHTLGQDEASCVVYGMPKAAFELGAVERQVPLERMGAAILALCDAQASEAA